MSWSVDDYTWDLPCTIEREAEVTPSDISGMLLDKHYFNDVIGTWMRYTVSIAVPKGWESEYTTVYEMLTAPFDGHRFDLPYNEGRLQITARVSNVRDAWVRLPKGKQTWRKITFDIIANHPTKTVELDEVISEGLAPTPGVAEAEVGTLFEYTNYGWIQRYYENAEDVSF